MYKLYKIEDWWGLREIEFIPGYGYGIGYGLDCGISKGYMETCYYPYAVGFKKQKFSSKHEIKESIKNAVLEAFDFLTTNPKSIFIRNGTFERKCVGQKLAELRECWNDYYYLQPDSVPCRHVEGVPIFEKHLENNEHHFPIQFTEFETEDYKVFIAKSQPYTWSLAKKPWNSSEIEKKDLWISWGLGLTILMLLIVVPTGIAEIKQRKNRKLSLIIRSSALNSNNMFIGKTRSGVRAEIDTQFEILQQMIEDLADHYHKEECDFDEKVNQIYEEASKYDYETYSNMTQGYDEKQNDYYCKSVEERKVLFCAIFSYFESMLYGIIKFYGIQRGRTKLLDELLGVIKREYKERFNDELCISEDVQNMICDHYRPLRNYFMHGELNPGKELDNLTIFVDKEEVLHRNLNNSIEITDNDFLRKALTLIHGFLCAIDDSFIEKIREEYKRLNG